HRELDARAWTHPPSIHHRKPVREVDPHASAKTGHVLAIDVGIGRIIAVPGSLERPRQIGRAIETRAAEPNDRSLELLLEVRPCHPDAVRDLFARPDDRLSPVLETVAEDVVPPELRGASWREMTRRRPGDHAEGGRMAASLDLGDERPQPRGVREARGLQIVRDRRRRRVWRRPARDTNQG